MEELKVKTESRFIPGIYNYCDYWCARCEFTRRCRNFSMGREMEKRLGEDAEEPDDTANSDFWASLAEKVREAQMFGGEREEWQELEPDDADFEIDQEWLEREEAVRDAVRKHPLSVMAYEYLKQAGDWAKGADQDLKALARELLEAAGGRFHDDDYEERALEIGDLLDVVLWYHTLIPSKIGRALHGLLELDADKDSLPQFLAESRLSDANGSGKIVLVAIDRSIGAWLRLREILPAHEDAILQMLALLIRIQRGIHETLPGAKSFFRPGFDGEPMDDEA